MTDNPDAKVPVLADLVSRLFGPVFGPLTAPILHVIERLVRRSGAADQKLDEIAANLAVVSASAFVARLRGIYRLRGTVFLIAWVASLIAAARWSHGPELGFVVRHLSLAATSVVAGWSFFILIGNVVLGSAGVGLRLLEQYVPTATTEKLLKSDLGGAARVIVQLNRQAGHLEALLPWVTIFCVSTTDFSLQLFGSFGFAMFGGLVADGLTGLVRGDWTLKATQLNETELHWDRRIIFHVTALIGLIWLLCLNTEQQAIAMPLCGAVAVGVLLRTVAWILWFRWGRNKQDDHVLSFRRTVLDDAGDWDRLVTILAIVGLAWVPIHNLTRGLAMQDRATRARSTFWTSCAKEPPGFNRQMSLFLVADTQFHELSGQLNGGHVDLVDSIVPVAVRPVEQDLLSGVTLGHFAALYRQLAADFAQQAPGQQMLWAHLGDIGDLGCQGELARLTGYLPAFSALPARSLAALTPGNHDSTFTGNFEWHPDWCKTGACPSGRVDKHGVQGANALLSAMERRYLAQGAVVSPHPQSSFLAHVVPLGAITLGSEKREIVGAFMDTSAFGRLRLGIAGAQGTIGDEQMAWVETTLSKRPDALFVVFQHHPFSDLDGGSQDRLTHLFQEFDGRGLAIVSAHTHQAGPRMLGLGSQRVPEFVIGSTTDPPQEAAILDVGGAGDGRVQLEVTTLPAVARDGMTCGYASPLSGNHCNELLASLKNRPACAELFDGDRRSLEQSSHCKELVSTWWPVDAPVGPDELHGRSDPEAIKCTQQDRAWRLLKCIGTNASELKRAPLDVAYDYDRLALSCDPQDEACQVPNRGELLVCLSWVASILQEHKAKGWAFPQAAAHAFESLATPGARRMVATVEVKSRSKPVAISRALH